MSIIDGLNERVTRVEQTVREVATHFEDLGRQLRDLADVVAKLQRAAETSTSTPRASSTSTSTKTDTATPKTAGKST